jgi:cell division protein FtsB
MARPRTRPSVGSLIYLTLSFTAGAYFAIAGVQGEYGLFRRIQIDAEAQTLRQEQAALETEVSALRNRTHRMSDDFLDLDLLDQQARDVLGYLRADEVVIR